MSRPISDLADLLRNLRPVRHDGVHVFALLPPGASLDALQPIASFREDEGLTVVVPEAVAQQAGWPMQFRAAWISLGVHSDLQAVGLTAAVASALAEAGIACNVIAAVHHDHLFVPLALADRAMAVLEALPERRAPARV